jgi:cellulose synthase/poly-beta-1,6-N-acetylglucosamine synthase-like glycosyltransferase
VGAAKVLFWGSFAGIAWTQAGYPAIALLSARARRRRTWTAEELPSVTVVVPAYNEETVIERRIANLRELDYPHDRVEIVVTSDASTDATEARARAAGARVLGNARGGKVAAQDHAVRETASELLAFSDANSRWAPDALRRLVAPFSDPDVAYVCGQLRLEPAEGGNKEGIYWRYELALREAESALGSITGGNGAIYAVRRSDYVEVDPRFGHDLSLPYLMVQHGKRAVYEPRALAYEKPTPSNETEYRRKVRMFEHCWLIVLRGRMLRGQPPGYALALVSHRHLRYAVGVLHLVLLGSSLVLVRSGWPYGAALAGQLAVVAAAGAGIGIARYYVLVAAATSVALWNYLRHGVPATWQPAEGTR